MLRIIALFVEVEDPRRTDFYWRFLAHILYVFRKALLVLFVLLAFDPKLELAFPLGESVLCIVLLGAGAALLAYLATSARIAVQFQALSPTKETIRSMLLECFPLRYRRLCGLRIHYRLIADSLSRYLPNC